MNDENRTLASTDHSTPADVIDRYWSALTKNEVDYQQQIRQSSTGQAEFAPFELLDALNQARHTLDEDSTLNVADDRTIGQRDSEFELGDASLQPGTMVGGYEIIRRLGAGGMGVVYAAKQVALGRNVALKLIRSGPLATPDELARFETEIAATAALQHPGIVAIHETGVWQGFHYFSMRLVEGITLREMVAMGPLTPQSAAQMAMQIADAVAHAHQHSVLHRDLKPSNVIVERSSGKPVVADFGLAKLTHSGAPTDAIDRSGRRELTVSGAMVGTPSYMSPEQAIGESHRVSPASDVYSIGAVLYELVAGRPPFRAATPIETLRQVVDFEPVSPRSLNRSIPRDLETICLKCLAKIPSDRYITAAEVREELTRFVESKPILARPLSPLARTVRWSVRNPRTAALVGLLITSLVGGAATSLAMWRRSEFKATQLKRSNEHLGSALESFYERALREDAVQHFSADFNYDLSTQVQRITRR